MKLNRELSRALLALITAALLFEYICTNVSVSFPEEHIVEMLCSCLTVCKEGRRELEVLFT